MWFRQKQINRRLGRVHVLDVKLRSDQVRRTRVRWGTLAAGVMLGTGFGLYLMWRVGDWALDRMVYQNPAFAIKEIEVQTDGVIAETELRRWAGVKPGENLLALDLMRLKHNLEGIPFLATVSVERILPQTLRLRVTERDAVAQLMVMQTRAGGGVQTNVVHLDSEGVVMPPMQPQQRSTAAGPTEEILPCLTGLNLTNVPWGRRLESPQVTSGLRLIGEFSSSRMAGLVDLRRIDVSAQDVLVVTTGQGSEVTFALQGLDWQLRCWREIYDQVPLLKSNRVAVDLAVSNNIPIRLLEANLSPGASPKTAKPPRTKKRHV